MKKSYLFGLLLLLSLTLSSCTSDEMSLDADVHSSTRALMQLNINTSGGTAYQSQLNELRLLMFESESGDCVYNGLLTIDSNDNLSNYANRKSLQFDELEFEKGTYDVVLLGNENSTISDLTGYRQALQEVENITDFNEKEFQQIPYNYEETGRVFKQRHYLKPQGPLLLSAYQKNVKIQGGTRREPQRIRVQLAASLALLEVVFVNAWERSGLPSPTTIPLTKRIEKITLNNVVGHYSNPATIEINPGNRKNLQFDFKIPEENYAQTEIAKYQFYIPEAILNNGILKQPAKTSISLEGADVKATVQLETNEKMYSDDIRLYPRLFNERTEVGKYINGLEESFWDVLFSSDTTSSYLRNIKYQLIVYLHPGDRDIELRLKVANWVVKHTTVNFNNEGDLEPSSVENTQLKTSILW